MANGMLELATLALAAILAITVREFDTLLGVAPQSPLRWLFPTAYVAAALVGTVWALILRAAKPEIYQAVGLGAESATASLRSPDAIRQPA
ncbi:hypothetical protein [Micromonospora sp. NPDC005220]|uniref:hypothetical protein n=1 Tax=Micromonospora sp. NPDC005220 TaxID=3155589 RepID=UPI0033A27770